MDLLLWIFIPLISLLLLLLNPFSRRNLPPGPYPWPVIGNMMSMRSGAPHVDLMKLARVHGPLMLVKLGMQPVIVASTQESAMEILRTHDKVFSGRFVPHSLRMKDHIKHLVVWTHCTDGWNNLRQVARTKPFSTKMWDAHVHVRQQKVGEMVDYIREKGGGETR